MSTHTVTEDAITAVLRELLSSALVDGEMRISWADVPKLIKKLHAAGIDVEGVDQFGKKRLVLSGIVIPVE